MAAQPQQRYKRSALQDARVRIRPSPVFTGLQMCHQFENRTLLVLVRGPGAYFFLQHSIAQVVVAAEVIPRYKKTDYMYMSQDSIADP